MLFAQLQWASDYNDNENCASAAWKNFDAQQHDYK